MNNETQTNEIKEGVICTEFETADQREVTTIKPETPKINSGIDWDSNPTTF